MNLRQIELYPHTINVTLPDGSNIQLKEGSKITAGVEYTLHRWLGGSNRSVDHSLMKKWLHDNSVRLCDN